MKTVLMFYKGFYGAITAINLFTCFLLWKSQNPFFVSALVPMKVITNFLIGIYVSMFQSQQFYFFHNLGFSKQKIFSLAFLFDFLLWITLISLTLLFFL